MAHHPNVHRKRYSLFGGDEAWSAADWTSSDDRVRGGKSQSYLECGDKTGRFHGTLDIKTLGGAGFASQRTTGEDREWDLSDYAGIEICVKKGDKKRYTFNLKTELLKPHPETGREQSSVSYECDFELPPQAEPGHAHDRTVFIPWESFNATYRGRPKQDAKPLDTKKIKRMSIMMRSFFGAQEGDFSLAMRSICAVSKAPEHGAALFTVVDVDLEKGHADDETLSKEDDAFLDHNPRSQQAGDRKRNLYVLLGLTTLLLVYVVMRTPMFCH